MAMLLPSFFSLSSSSSFSLSLPTQAFSFEEAEGIWAWLLLGIALFLSFAIPCGAAAAAAQNSRRSCSPSSEKLLRKSIEVRQIKSGSRRRKSVADSSRGSHSYSHSHRISPIPASGKRVSNQALLRLRRTLLDSNQSEAPSDKRILTVTTVLDSHPCRIMIRSNRSPPPGIVESLHTLDSRHSIIRSDVSPFLTQLRNRRSKPTASGLIIDESEVDPPFDQYLPQLARKSQQIVHRRRSTIFPADIITQHKMIDSVSSSSAITLPHLTDSSNSCNDLKDWKQTDCTLDSVDSIQAGNSDTIQAADSIADSEKQIVKEVSQMEEMVDTLHSSSSSSSSSVITSRLTDPMSSCNDQKELKQTDCAVDLMDSIQLRNSDTLQVTNLTVDSEQKIMKEVIQMEEMANALPSFSSSSSAKTSSVTDLKSSFNDQKDPKQTDCVVDMVDPMKISRSKADSARIGNADTVQATDSIKASEQQNTKETLRTVEMVDVSPSSSSGKMLSLSDSSSSFNQKEALKQTDCADYLLLCTVDVVDPMKINITLCNCESDLIAIQNANTIQEATDSEEWMAKEVGRTDEIINTSTSSSCSSMKMQHLTDTWSSCNHQGGFKQTNYAADIADSMKTNGFCNHKADLTQVRNADLIHEVADSGQWIAKGVNQTEETTGSLSSSLSLMKMPSLVDSRSYCTNQGESKQTDCACSQHDPSSLIEQSFSCQTHNEFISPIKARLPQIDLMLDAVEAETEVNHSNSSSIEAISLPEIVETACMSMTESANPSSLYSKSEEKNEIVTAVSSSWLEVGIEQGKLLSSTIIETADESKSKICVGNSDEGILSDPQTWWDEDAVLIEPEASNPKEWNDAPPRLFGDWFLF